MQQQHNKKKTKLYHHPRRVTQKREGWRRERGRQKTQNKKK